MYKYKDKTYDYGDEQYLIEAIEKDAEDRKVYRKLDEYETQTFLQNHWKQIQENVIDQLVDGEVIKYIPDSEDTEAQEYKEKIDALKERDKRQKEAEKMYYCYRKNDGYMYMSKEGELMWGYKDEIKRMEGKVLYFETEDKAQDMGYKAYTEWNEMQYMFDVQHKEDDGEPDV